MPLPILEIKNVWLDLVAPLAAIAISLVTIVAAVVAALRTRVH